MNLFEMFATLGVNTTDFNSKISGAKEKFEKVGNAIKKSASVIAKATAGAFSGAAVGIAALTKKSADAYANYEQLVGGIQTLFGAGGKSLEEYAKAEGKTVEQVRDEYNKLMKSQEDVLTNAANAYATAGMSANQYMETITSFAATLTNSLGGDTSEAARLADMAIQDMADNANKMGSDLNNIQLAYQSLSRGNFAMLDNLKLG